MTDDVSNESVETRDGLALGDIQRAQAEIRQALTDMPNAKASIFMTSDPAALDGILRTLQTIEHDALVAAAERKAR